MLSTTGTQYCIKPSAMHRYVHEVVQSNIRASLARATDQPVGESIEVFEVLFQEQEERATKA